MNTLTQTDFESFSNPVMGICEISLWMSNIRPPPLEFLSFLYTLYGQVSHSSMETDQLPDRVHPIGSETKYRVFNNQITDNVDIYHSEATTHKPKVCTMKYTENIRAHTVTTHIQPQNPEIIYEHLPYCPYQPYSFKCDKYISMVTK